MKLCIAFLFSLFLSPPIYCSDFVLSPDYPSGTTKYTVVQGDTIGGGNFSERTYDSINTVVSSFDIVSIEMKIQNYSSYARVKDQIIPAGKDSILDYFAAFLKLQPIRIEIQRNPLRATTNLESLAIELAKSPQYGSMDQKDLEILKIFVENPRNANGQLDQLSRATRLLYINGLLGRKFTDEPTTEQGKPDITCFRVRRESYVELHYLLEMSIENEDVKSTITLLLQNDGKPKALDFSYLFR